MIREFVKGNNKTDAGVKEKTPALKKKYEVIYADPPWRFRVRTEKGKGRSAENHYPITGDVSRVELFARQKTPGWDTWGNEVENDLELAA